MVTALTALMVCLVMVLVMLLLLIRERRDLLLMALQESRLLVRFVDNLIYYIQQNKGHRFYSVSQFFTMEVSVMFD